jgi:hypothetical protein
MKSEENYSAILSAQEKSSFLQQEKHTSAEACKVTYTYMHVTHKQLPERHDELNEETL